MSASRDGLVLPEIVARAGVPERTFRRWVADGEWEQWDNRVYGHRGLIRTFERRALAATMACGETAVASHFTAAFLHGLFEIGRPKVIEVTVPYDEVRTPRTAVIHRSRHLTEDDRGEPIAGVPVTSVARTICDIAPRIGVRVLEQIVMDGVRREIVAEDELTVMLGRLGRTRAGSRKLRRIVAALHPDIARLRSHLEVVAVPVLRSTGIPGLRIGYLVVDASGRTIAELDFAYPDVKLAVEIDGLRWHATRQQKEADDHRQNRLVRDGWTVLRFTLTDLTDRPEWVRSQVIAVHRRLAAA